MASRLQSRHQMRALALTVLSACAVGAPPGFSHGDTWTFPEYRAWLEAAGFRDARQMPAAAPSPLILATKA